MDFTDKYNTPLSLDEEKQFRVWAHELSKTRGRDILADLGDYDMRGAWVSGATTSENAHFPDTFKKPNHPTFSQESMYHGRDGYIGGMWEKNPTGAYTYTASPSNMYDAESLKNYFKDAEQGSTLNTDYMSGVK